MIVYRLNNKWDMVKFLDLQAITMRHGGNHSIFRLDISC